MTFEIIDSSAAIENDIASDPPGALHKVTYVDHTAHSTGWRPFPRPHPARSAGRRRLGHPYCLLGMTV